MTYADLAAAQLERRALDRAAHALGELDAVVGVAADQQGELFAAVTGRHVGLADDRLQGGADAFEQVVAGFVAVAVVEALEVVEVEHDQGELAAVAVGLGDLVVQVVGEGAVVVEAGQAVGERRGGQRALALVLVALHAAEDEARQAERGETHDRLARGAGVDRLAQGGPGHKEAAEPACDHQAAELEEEHRAEQQREDEERPQVERAARQQRAGDGDERACEGRHAAHGDATTDDIGV